MIGLDSYSTQVFIYLDHILIYISLCIDYLFEIRKIAVCFLFFSVAIDPILFKPAGNEDMHNILDEFEFRPDRTTDYGVSCPWASEKNPIP